MFSYFLKSLLLLSIFTTLSYASSYNANNTNNLDNAIIKLSNRLLSSSKVLPTTLKDIAITTFVNLDDYQETSVVGKLLSESMFNELFTKGFDIIDFQRQNSITVENDELDDVILNKYILVGTYSIFGKSIFINSRIIDNLSGRVIASARIQYNSNNCQLTNSCNKKSDLVVSKKQPRISAAKKI